MRVVLTIFKYSFPINDPCCYPLGAMYVSKYFKMRGHKVKVLNYNLWDYDFEEEIKGSDLVCFSGFSEFKKQILKAEQICINNGIKTLIGGALATFGINCDLQSRLYPGEIDSQIPIDKIAWPDYEGFGIDEYHKRHDCRYMGVLTTRGCPYSCIFCAQTCKFRMRELDFVFREIDYYIERYKIERVIFNDNTLNINKSRFMRICEEIRRRGLEWTAAIRLSPLDDEMVRAIKDSNCRTLVVGVESLNDDKLKRLNKKIKANKILRSLDLLNKYKIPYHGNILVGFADETVSDIANEIANIPIEYNLNPVLVRHFDGTRHSRERMIGCEQEMTLESIFQQMAAAKGLRYDTAGI